MLVRAPAIQQIRGFREVHRLKVCATSVVDLFVSLYDLDKLRYRNSQADEMIADNVVISDSNAMAIVHFVLFTSVTKRLYWE